MVALAGQVVNHRRTFHNAADVLHPFWPPCYQVQRVKELIVAAAVQYTVIQYRRRFYQAISFVSPSFLTVEDINCVNIVVVAAHIDDIIHSSG